MNTVNQLSFSFSPFKFLYPISNPVFKFGKLIGVTEKTYVTVAYTAKEAKRNIVYQIKKSLNLDLTSSITIDERYMIKQLISKSSLSNSLKNNDSTISRVEKIEERQIKLPL